METDISGGGGSTRQVSFFGSPDKNTILFWGCRDFPLRPPFRNTRPRSLHFQLLGAYHLCCCLVIGFRGLKSTRLEPWPPNKGLPLVVVAEGGACPAQEEGQPHIAMAIHLKI